MSVDINVGDLVICILAIELLVELQKMGKLLMQYTRHFFAPIFFLFPTKKWL